MFEEKYLIMETIGRQSTKSTSIVKNKQNQYFIAKKVKVNDSKTMNEINLMRTLKHPNVIQLHEIIYDEQEAYIIEEYCEEGDLEYYLRRQLKLKKRLPEDVVSRWMLQILLGIEYLHHSKIIHRDIRPKNIFLTSTGNLKLGSFKASKQLENEVCYAQTLINSSYYMTPELMEGKRYDTKVDMWAFGCVLYEVCWLKPLVNMVNLADLVNKVSNGKVEELPQSYSKQLNNIYLKCMRKNPNERLSASDLLKTSYFLNTLEKFISDQGLNITLQEKIPIKKYKIHRYKYERLKLKRGLVKDRQPSVEKRENLLPKLQQYAKNRMNSKSREKEKEKIIRTPVLKGTSIGKDSIVKSASTEKKKIKTQVHYRSREKVEKEDKPSPNLKQQFKELPRQTTKFMLAPPLLPKPAKKTLKVPEKPSSFRIVKTEDEPSENFETTMSKQSLSKELQKFQKKDLKEIDQGLNKIFQSWKMSEQQQIQFEFEEESELRLTAKASQEDSANMLKTVKSKLEQLIEEINYKYCPDMEPISEKTMEFDSNSLSQFNIKKVT